MKAYLGFDDTDNHDSLYGTGKLVRWFQKKLPDECQCLGVVRQQLLVCDDIPYTSHNSSACLIVEMPDPSYLENIIADAVSHIRKYAVLGSDPGLCVATELDPSIEEIVDYGRQCAHSVSNQKKALRAASKVHLSGHGGSNDGIIGAAAAVGLTHAGWTGRYIELGHLRDWPERTTVAQLKESGIEALSIDRDARLPAPHDMIITNGWLRPRLIAHRPTLLVRPQGASNWENIDRKRKKRDQSVLQMTP